MKYFVTMGGRTREVDLEERLGELRITVDGVPLDLSYEEVDRFGQVVLLCEGNSFAVSIEGDENRVGVTLAGYHYAMEIEDEREAGKSGGIVVATMPGVVVEILVAPGEEVEAGAPLLILEAMKMQNEIDAPSGGVVKSVHVTAGQAVSSGERLVTLA